MTTNIQSIVQHGAKRQTDRHTDKHIDRKTDRHKHNIHKLKELQTYIHYRKVQRYTNTKNRNNTDIQTDLKTDIQT